MEKIGLQVSIIKKFYDIYKIEDEIRKLDQSILKASLFKQNTKIFADIEKTKDIAYIINYEKLALIQEMEYYKKDSEFVTSVKIALKELDKALHLYPLVKDKSQYDNVNKAISDRREDRKNGLPKDAFHKSLNSHKTRLQNRVKAPSSCPEEKEFLKQRIDSLKTAIKEYEKFQTFIMGM